MSENTLIVNDEIAQRYDPRIFRVNSRSSVTSYKYPLHAQLRKYIHERDGYACKICGVKAKMKEGYEGQAVLLCESSRFALLELDHIIPRSRGGRTCVENLQTLCSSCNARKGNRT